MNRSQTVHLLLLTAALLALNLTAGLSAKYIAVNWGRWLLVAALGVVLAGSYGSRVFLWLHAGRIYQLSFVYPLLSLNYLVSTLLGWELFQEAITRGRIAGLALIILGVVLITLSPHRLEPRAAT